MTLIVIQIILLLLIYFKFCFKLYRQRVSTIKQTLKIHIYYLPRYTVLCFIIIYAFDKRQRFMYTITNDY